MFTGGPGKLDNTCSGWRDAANYTFVEALPAASCAWEFLRRNPAYQEAWRAFVSQRSPFSSDAAVWGLVRFESPERDARLAKVFWLPASLPSVIPLMSLPRDLADANRKGGPVPLGPAVTQQEPARTRPDTEYRIPPAHPRSQRRANALRRSAPRPGVRDSRRSGNSPVALPGRTRRGTGSHGIASCPPRASDPRVARGRCPARKSELSHHRRSALRQQPNTGPRLEDSRHSRSDRAPHAPGIRANAGRLSPAVALSLPASNRSSQQGWRSPRLVRSPSHRAGHLRHRP